MFFLMLDTFLTNAPLLMDWVKIVFSLVLLKFKEESGKVWLRRKTPRDVLRERGKLTTNTTILLTEINRARRLVY